MAQKALDSLTPEFALKVFVLDGQARNLSLKTLTTYEQQLTWFIDFARGQGVDYLADVRSHHLKSYLVSLQERGWKPASRIVVSRVLERENAK